MMNVLALGLVLTSLVTAGFFTPSPENQNLKKQDIIVKEGHRVIVVEYEKDDGNTKVSISPQDPQPHNEKGLISEAKDKLSEKMADLKQGTEKASSSVFQETGEVENQEKEEEAHHRFSARELVCDAYGKCKHKLAAAMGKTAETAAEEAADLAGKVKEAVSGTAHKAKESAKDSASQISAKAKEKAKEQVGEVRENVEGAKEMVAEKARDVGREGKKELREILGHAREVAVDVFDYVFSPEKVSPAAGVLHLMGFAAAYGMCVWVTFASSYVLAGALPRNQFAMVQSKVYPVYFQAMAYSVGIALLGHLMGPRNRLSGGGGGGMFQGFNLMASLAMILVNLMYLEPRANKVMMERMKKEKEEGRAKEGNEPVGRVVDSTAEAAGRVSSTGATIGSTVEKPVEDAAAKSQMIRLSERLQRLNSHSSLLNVLTLMSLTWHLVHLGQRLNVAC